MGASRLKGFECNEFRSAETGLVGRLGLKPKFIKFDARPFPDAIDEFQRSSCCCDADGASPQALWAP
jgi:hypothetical protein